MDNDPTAASRRLPHDWFDAPLPDNVQLHPRSWLYSTYAFRHYASQLPLGLRVGSESGLYHGTFFDLGPRGSVEIGAYCTLVGVILATNHRVVIEDYAFLAHEVVLADTPHAIPDAHPQADQVAAAVRSEEDRLAIRIGENAWIGAGATLLYGARIGRNAIVGAGALVDFAVPDECIVVGNPATIRKRSAPPKTT